MSSALLNACTSDRTQDLGSGYTLVIEGGDQNLIIHEEAGIEGVPPSVFKVAYDDDFIVATQIPNPFDDVVYGREYEYHYGRVATYFWIIDKDRMLLKGPFGETEYQAAKQLWGVPAELTPVHFY